MAEHASPQMHELGLVEAAVFVDVEHVDRVSRHLHVEAEAFLQDRRDLVRRQNSVSVCVQPVEAARYVVVATQHQSYRHSIGPLYNTG